MEKWDILDAHGSRTGRKAIRGSTELKPGEYHLVVHIWVISPNGHLLLQKRSSEKALMPGEWAATGGAAIAGESSLDAAMRELREELGIKSTKETIRFVKRIKKRNSFVDVWFIKCDTPAEELTLQKSEVAKVEWVTPSDLEERFKSGAFHNYGRYYWSIIFSEINRELKYEQPTTV